MGSPLFQGLRSAKCEVRTETWTLGIRIPVREVAGNVVCWKRNIGSNKNPAALQIYDSV